MRCGRRALSPIVACGSAVALQQRKGTNVAAVALANKMARVAWALLAHDRDYVSTYTRARPSLATAG